MLRYDKKKEDRETSASPISGETKEDYSHEKEVPYSMGHSIYFVIEFSDFYTFFQRGLCLG